MSNIMKVREADDHEMKEAFPDDTWFPLRLSMGQMPEDFMADREQPSWDDASMRENF